MEIIIGESIAYLSVYLNEMENMYVVWEIKLIFSSNWIKLFIYR